MLHTERKKSMVFITIIIVIVAKRSILRELREENCDSIGICTKSKRKGNDDELKDTRRQLYSFSVVCPEIVRDV